MKKWDAGSLAILLMAYIMGILFGMIRQQLESADTMIEVESQSKAQDVAWKKQVAITFDDGPNPNYTVKLLDGLKKRGVKATFFLLGSEVEQYPEIVEAIHENGHLIGVHSYEHVNFGQIGDAAAVEQIDRTQEAIYDVTGEYAGYIRPPYGCWKKELDTEVPMIEVLWDVVILLHDASESSVQAALTTIDILQEQEYEFVTVEELLLE